MPTRLDHALGRRLGVLLLAAAVVVLAWCALGGARAAAATPAPSIAASSMQGTDGDETTHAASVDQGTRAGHVQVHQVAPDAAPAAVVTAAAPRPSAVVEPAAERGPPRGTRPAATGSRAPPA